MEWLKSKLGKEKTNTEAERTERKEGEVGVGGERARDNENSNSKQILRSSESFKQKNMYCVNRNIDEKGQYKNT